ncbi:MAG: hypothetical protein ACW987_02515 [Candidatus Thorarchaeota archaeon]
MARVAAALSVVGLPVTAVSAVTKKEEPKIRKVEWGEPPTIKAVVEPVDPALTPDNFSFMYSESVYCHDMPEFGSVDYSKDDFPNIITFGPGELLFGTSPMHQPITITKPLFDQTNKEIDEEMMRKLKCIK